MGMVQDIDQDTRQAVKSYRSSMKTLQLHMLRAHAEVTKGVLGCIEAELERMTSEPDEEDEEAAPARKTRGRRSGKVAVE